jgi:mannose-6-phosphate isomerase-like protein (cupin superfamily)
MADRTVVKVDAMHAPKGPEGQRYLAAGRSLSMRLWQNEAPDAAKKPVRRDYETVGFVIAGRAELSIEGQVIRLEPGESWIVPKGAEHSYRILEPFTAVEATHPPAEIHGRDQPPAA